MQAISKKPYTMFLQSGCAHASDEEIGNHGHRRIGGQKIERYPIESFVTRELTHDTLTYNARAHRRAEQREARPSAARC
jgi:hypothetical protein